MISKKRFWDLLSEEQKEMIQKNMLRCVNEEGEDPVIEDAQDLWWLLPKSERDKIKKPV